MNKLLVLLVSLFLYHPYQVKKGDLNKDVELVTSKGTMVIRLSDSTPLHRDNFIKLVNQHYYDGLLFHRVMQQFMIQAGDPKSKTAKASDHLGGGSPGYTIPAEIKPYLFHKKGALAAARTPDEINPARESNGSQFFIVQGRVYDDADLNQVEARLNGYKIPEAHREVFKTLGGSPSLDTKYTVFGEVIKGLDVIDSIAAVPVGESNRPVEDVRIIKATLIKRQ
ncbi:peptidylprolyl isomerase [Niastella koreensis]|uniref:peptidylprolyl isomerase n=2 Tax=Niastella koreensis TaxID=354356 RepID=G8TMJ2_NIAKG|nr:peptidylprolyl isomerase [Niastella koreensis]AEW01980.1 peptidyl-prolyl cis-trans isomerase cyclophilin type [Niastella koreensis GR20-10]OQP48677.1 peptidylprolyl isomerase [Niastella koreensis]